MIQITIEYIKDFDTNKYIEVSNESKDLLEHEYNNIVSIDTIKYFRRLGGKEIVTKDKDNNIIKLVSISPDKEAKVVREFRKKELKTANYVETNNKNRNKRYNIL
jgi:hypothetical protein